MEKCKDISRCCVNCAEDRTLPLIFQVSNGVTGNYLNDNYKISHENSRYNTRCWGHSNTFCVPTAR